MPNAQFAFGVDLSRYNTSPDGHKKVDFDTFVNHDPEVVFVGMRAGISWGYQDTWFAYYFAEAARTNRVRLPYHVLYPGESATRQMDHFFRIVGQIDFALVPLVLDLELHHNHSASRITDTTAQSVEIITARTGRAPILYSRTNWVNAYLHTSRLPPVHWWLAQYRFPLPYPLTTPEYPSPPQPLPIGVNTWLIHQSADRGRSIGTQAMYYMDYNRWNGTRKDVYQFINQQAPQAVTCPIDSQPCPRLFEKG